MKFIKCNKLCKCPFTHTSFIINVLLNCIFYVWLPCVVWRLWSHHNSAEWWVPDNWDPPRDLRPLFVFPVLCCRISILHWRRLLFLQLVGTICCWCFHSDCRLHGGNCRLLDLRFVYLGFKNRREIYPLIYIHILIVQDYVDDNDDDEVMKLKRN